jgi:methyl-accepting chemotaxis protein
LVPILIIGWISYDKGKSSLEAEAFNRLTAVREMKASQIDAYFGQIHDQVLTFSEDPTIAEAMRQFKDGFANVQNDLGKTPEEVAQHTINVKAYFDDVYMKELLPNLDSMDEQVHDMPTDDVQALLLQDLYIASNIQDVGSKQQLYDAGDSSMYTKAHKKYHPIIKNYLDKFGYYDIFLIDHETGHIVYSVFKEVDFGTSLINGPFSNTNIADAFREADAAGEETFVEGWCRDNSRIVRTTNVS